LTFLLNAIDKESKAMNNRLKLRLARGLGAIVVSGIVLGLTLAVVAGGFTWQAAAQKPSGGGSAGTSNNIFAVGAFTPINGDHFAFADQKNPQTGAMSGYVVQSTAAGQTRSGKVTCLDVDSTTGQARIRWDVQHSTVDPSEVGQNRELDVTDMGEPNGITPGPDTYTDDGNCDMNNMCSDCGTMPKGGAMMVVNGNIVVKGP
jgi:hypothetical protein